MRALIATGNIDRLVEMGEVATPSPSEHEILVEVEAFSLNRPDFLWLAAPGSQWRVGIDFVGRVTKPARDGTGPARGDRVMVHAPHGGGGAEFAVAHARQAVTLPAEISNPVAAALPLAGLVALRLIRDAGIRRGHRVLITGATGGVGHLAVQLALNTGATVTALARPIEKTDSIEARGARVIHSLDDVSEPFDVILESIGGDTLTQALLKLSHKGLVMWFGAASGQAASIDFFSFFPDRSSFTIKHFVYNEVGGDDYLDLSHLVDLVTKKVLTIDVSKEANWSQTSEILNAIKLGTVAGKSVLIVKN
ncbi:MAG: zinc-binding dehydrogenase [Brucella anthropi]